MNHKKNKSFIIFLFLVILLNLMEFAKYKIFNMNFSVTNFILKFVVLILFLFVNNFRKTKNKFFKKYINVFLIVASLLSLLFSSINVLGLILLYVFIMIVTLTISNIFKLKFEISLPVSISILIFSFIMIAIAGLLKYSYIFLILFTLGCLVYIYKNKSEVLNQINKINTTSFVIFSVLFLIAILSGIGRYVHVWDEYSYWAYAAKVIINTDSLRELVSYTGSSYPPVSSIWHYVFSLFCGYSESNLYIGLTILDFIYIMPIFIKLNKKNTLLNILFVLVSIFIPYLFNGSISYSLLYVDLSLGFLCSSTLIIDDYLRKKNKSLFPVFIILIIITLLKPNGFVFSSCLLLLFFLKNLISYDEHKHINFNKFFEKLKKYIFPVFTVLLVFLAWKLLANTFMNSGHNYSYKLIPDSLKTDLSQKLNATFMLNYFNSLIQSMDDTIIHSFINIPLFAFIIIIFSLIFKIDNKEKKYGIFKSLFPYFVFYFVFYVITALSLFIMFSYYEASKLASFSRYLAPINIALIAYLLYKSSYICKNKKILKFICLIIIALIGFSNLTFFVTDIKQRRETMHVSESRNSAFSEIVNKTSKKSKIFIINQEDTDNIMPIWYARYYCFPRMVNANSNAITWKIKTNSNAWDLSDWGLTNSTFNKHIIQYKFDYVFLYTSTDELYEILKDDFIDEKEAKKYKLFKIKKDETKVKLIPVK